MTTIAWDGKTLAGDTRCVAGGFCFGTVKIWRLTDGRLFGGSGNAEDCEAVRHWLEHPQEPKPTVKDFAGIVISPDGRCHRVEDKLFIFEVTTPFHAVGSGRDYAMAAMHYGIPAVDAVRLACIYDAYTGGEITELQLAI